MEYRPPIVNRETKALLEMVRSPENWEKEAIMQAQSELVSRGIGIEKQRRQEKSFKRALQKTLKIKESAKLSKIQFILLALFGLPIALILEDPSMFYDDPEYKTKRRQKLLALIFGVLFWCIIIYLILS